MSIPHSSHLNTLAHIVIDDKQLPENKRYTSLGKTCTHLRRKDKSNSLPPNNNWNSTPLHPELSLTNSFQLQDSATVTIFETIFEVHKITDTTVTSQVQKKKKRTVSPCKGCTFVYQRWLFSKIGARQPALTISYRSLMHCGRGPADSDRTGHKLNPSATWQVWKCL